MRKVTKWIHGQIDYRDRYNPPKYLVVCMGDKIHIKGTTRFSFKVLCYDDLEEAKYWLDMYVAKADRDQYVIYKLLKEKE